MENMYIAFCQKVIIRITIRGQFGWPKKSARADTIYVTLCERLITANIIKLCILIDAILYLHILQSWYLLLGYKINLKMDIRIYIYTCFEIGFVSKNLTNVYDS